MCKKINRNIKKIKTMDKEFVPYEQASQLKELGFDYKCLLSYIDEILCFPQELYGNLDTCSFNSNNDTMYENEISAPLYQQAFKWFRNKDIVIDISNHDNNVYEYYIKWSTTKSILSDIYTTYEETQLECLKRLIKIIKNNE